ncbi:Hypothetical predicted protein [Mytilus galloprovincialis]|uniref:Uncharacterized protein n=1 Tax=Mytilus galloprovincialis TaxID=29158 RepID=A0A8B6FFR6_MYTGA|nr:Hypothetical predicted protein [Mytilus galloprovincialis]
MSLVDGTEEDVRQSWSVLDTKNPKRKRDDSVPNRKGEIKHRKVFNHSSSFYEHTSSSESSSSNSAPESSEDNEAFDPEPSMSKDEKVPSHITKYIEKYAIKGISKRTRQNMSLNLPIPSSKGLKALKIDRFFGEKNLQRRKWNARLERSNFNTQLRILDVMGPLKGPHTTCSLWVADRLSSPSTSFSEETLAGRPVTEQTVEHLWSAPEPYPEPIPDTTSKQPSVQETCKLIERVGQEKRLSHIQNYFQLPMRCIINQNSIPVGGRISNFLQNLNSITKDSWVLQCVKGTQLDFLSTPYQNQIPNQAFFNQEN